MKRLTVLATVAACGLAGAAAFAQGSGSQGTGSQGTGSQGTGSQGAPSSGQASAATARPAETFTRADRESLVDARIGAVRAGLRLTSDQERLWSPVEQAMRDAGRARIERWEAFRRMRDNTSSERPDFVQRLERGAEFAAENARNAKSMAEALKPLWATLDDRHRRILPLLMRPPGRMHHGIRGGEGRMWGMRSDQEQRSEGRGDREERRWGGRDEERGERWGRGGERDERREGRRDERDERRGWRDREDGPGRSFGWRDRDEDRDGWRQGRRERDDERGSWRRFERDDDWRRL